MGGPSEDETSCWLNCSPLGWVVVAGRGWWNTMQLLCDEMSVELEVQLSVQSLGDLVAIAVQPSPHTPHFHGNFLI